jgi:hypothetical protein
MPALATPPKPKSPTVQDFLKPEIIHDVENYLLARTFAEHKREQVDAIETQLLTEHVLMATLCTRDSKHCASRFPDDEPWRITQPKDMFMCEDEAAIREFYAELNRRERAAGIKPADMPDEHCPALCAETIQTQAEAVLIDSSGRLYGITADMLYLEKRDKWIDLVIRMLVNHPQTASHFTAAKMLAPYRKPTTPPMK